MISVNCQRLPYVGSTTIPDFNGGAGKQGFCSRLMQVENLIRKMCTLVNAGIPASLFWCVVALVLTLSGARDVVAGESDTWVLIDIGKMKLSVLQGDVVRRTYRNISIGRGGSTAEKKQHDGKTPLGKFHIVRMTTDTPFHRFFGLDYPDLERAERARQTGIINQTRYAAIRQTIQTRQVPPQETALGGYIGIHGIGEGSGVIHEDFNWTKGCIALTNAQIDDLSNWLRIGTKVVIRR